MPLYRGSRRLILQSRGGTFDAATTAWVNAVVAAGGTVSSTQKISVNNLIVALKGHGLWTNLDRMWLYASENAFQAKIDIVNLVSHTVSGTPTFTTSQGYTGNGTDFINTNFNPSANGVNYSSISASIGIYVRNNRASSNVTTLGVIDAGGLQTTLQLNAFTNQNIGTMHVTSIAVAGATTPQGFWVLSTTNTTATFYNKGSSIGTGGGAGSASAAVIYALALNNNGVTAQISSDQIAVVLMGGNYSSTGNANLSTDVNAYMTALGTNVY